MIAPQPGSVWHRAHRRQDRFARPVGLPSSPTINENKILIDTPITA